MKLTKKTLGDIVDRCYRIMEFQGGRIARRHQSHGYSTSTQAGITIGFQDIKIPPQKKEIMSQADKDVASVEELFRRGLVTENERYNKVIEIWNKATDDVTSHLMGNLDKFNPIYMMANSGARGNVQQIRQLAGLAVSWPILPVKLLTCPSKQISVKVLMFWNSSFLPTAPEKVWLILLSALRIPVILLAVWSMSLRKLSSEKKIAALPPVFG